MGRQTRQTQPLSPLNSNRLRFPKGTDLLRECAREIVARHRSSVPDLSSVTVILPHTIHSARLRRYLLESVAAASNTHALIPPQITTLKTFLLGNKIGDKASEYISSRECKYLLGAALHENPDLLPGINCWDAAERLITLFDEIDEHNAVHQTSLPLREESEKLASIYSSWRNTLKPQTLESFAYLQALIGETSTPCDKLVFLCGLDDPAPAEAKWLERQNHDDVIFIEYDTTPSAVGKFIASATRNDSVPPRERAEQYVQQTPQSPLLGKVSVFNPDDLEDHAFGVRSKIMDFLADGAETVAVVIYQDRKFARRLRALLMRQGIPVRDHSGWALSTTSSAATLLQLIPSRRQGYTAEHLLSLLYSVHCDYDIAPEVLKRLRLECTRRLNDTPQISGDLNEALNTLKNSKVSSELIALSKHIYEALRPLDKLRHSRQEHPMHHFFDALIKAMRTLGIDAKFQTDPAGQKILETIDKLQNLADQTHTQCNWTLWCSWLTHTLDSDNFTPPKLKEGVTFYNLHQSILLHADAIVLTSLDQRGERLNTQSMLLNDLSLECLQLKTRKDRNALSESRLQTLLESADNVLITHQKQNNRRSLLPVSWLEQLQNFHRLAYNDDLIDHQLARDAAEQARAGSSLPASPLPQIATAIPAPQASQTLSPAYLSAQSYQKALSCPYQFFAAYVLKLKLLNKQSRDYVGPSSYGNIVHRCLSALHKNIPGLPEPMERPWTYENLEHARELVKQIVETEFSIGSSHDYASAWRAYEATLALNQYVDWLMQKPYPDAEFLVEETQKVQLENLQIEGRIDNLIRTGDGSYVIDYKTGEVASKKSIENGEDVQIGFYTLLCPDAVTASYLQIKADKEVKQTMPSKLTIDELRERHRQRLVNFKHAYDQHARLPAWAEPSTCENCDYAGVCRRSDWKIKPQQSESGKV